MALSDLKTLMNASAQNLSQFKGLSAAYGILLGGTPSIDGYTNLINTNNSTNFGAGASGPTFNDENIYINTINALYQGNATAKSAFDAIVASAATIQDALTLVYNYVIPAASRTQAGLDYFKSQASFYASRAAELGVAGTNGTALVAFASLTKIAVDNDIGGLGDTINDLKAAVDNGTAAIPQGGDAFTPLETADGTQFDPDDVGGGSNQGQTFTLTTAVDAGVPFTGGTGDDTFNATDTTLTALDSLTGGAGNDTLKIDDVAGKNFTGLGFDLNGIENVTIRSAAGTVTFDSTTFADVTSLAVTKANNVVLTAGAATGVSVAGATGTITIDGGNDIAVTDATAAKAITIGATTVGKGNVTVTDTNVGGAAVAVDGGKNVTLNLTGSASSTITIGNGGSAADLPTGVVSVTSANKAVAGTDETLSSITAKGGSTITVNQTATSGVAATDTTGATVTQGAVTVVGGNGTTSVTVGQTASKAEVVAVTAVAGVTETASVKFSALTAGQTLILGGLTFTAAVAMTAAEAAAAFANLVNGTLPLAGDTQAGGAASKGTYTGNFTGWTSGAAAGDTVVFTSTTATTDVADLANTGTGTAVVTTTAGSAATAAVAGVLGVITGVVTIDDAATAAITTVSVDGYGTGSKIGDTATLSKLANLSLANSGGATAGATNATMLVDAVGVASLNLSLNNVKGAVSLDGAGDNALKTLNVTTTGADSSFALTAAAVETLSVAGTKKATFTADLAALKTVTVTGSAGLALSGAEDNTLTSVDASGTSGAVTASIDGAKATYKGGTGVDTVTLTTSTALTKAIDLGAGDDTLSFAALAVTGSTAVLSGGDGTDVLSMSVATADALDAVAQTFYTNFERLTLNSAAGDNDDTADTVTINLANLGFANYVTSNGTVLDATTATKSDTLVLDNLASGGTVEIVAAAAGANTKHTVNIKDAATGTADVLNVKLSTAGALNAGTVTAANVETVNLVLNDTDTTAHTDTLTLTAANATKLTVSGNAGATLTLTGSTALTVIDGSGITKGALTVTSLNTTSATTITGGAGNDVLTAATGTTADVLIGGAGSDTLTANAGLSTLTGGADADMFVINTASLNSSSYATITDFGAGDLIKMTGAASFRAAAITQADTAVFQDYANAAINAIGANAAAWFQYAGNTYIVMDAGGDTATFTNGQDVVVKLTGLVDLSTASFNSDQATIAL